MEIFKIVGFSLVAVITILILKSLKKEEFALGVTIIASVAIFVLVLLKLQDITNVLTNLVNKAGIKQEYLTILLKVTGISYIIELASNICKDAGSSALASKVEMMGKVSIIVITIPILTSVLSVVMDIM